MGARTKHLEMWLKRAGFMEGMRPHIAWVTSKEWAEIAAEVEELNLASEKPVISQPTNKTFQALRLLDGRLTIRNSGTEDQETCNTMNRLDLGTDAAIMAARAQKLFPICRLDEEMRLPNIG